MTTDKPLKAWRVTILTWPGMVAIYAAPDRSKAIHAGWKAANDPDAGYDIAWQDYRAHRAPSFDQLASKAKAGECLGWSYDGDGTSFGCLRPPDEHVRHLVGLAYTTASLELKLRESRRGVPMATLGNLASVTYFGRSQVYRVFEPYPGDAQKRTDYTDAAEVVKHLVELAAAKGAPC